MELSAITAFLARLMLILVSLLFGHKARAKSMNSRRPQAALRDLAQKHGPARPAPVMHLQIRAAGGGEPVNLGGLLVPCRARTP